MREKRVWIQWLTAVCAVVFFLGIVLPEPVQAAVIANRVKAVARTYPNGSYYNDFVTVSYKKNGVWRTYIGHECAGFVMHVTKETFQSPYYNGSPDYKRIYKTVSTKNTAEMKKLFSKAKIGDVIRWTGSGGSHQAIFMGNHRLGIQVYEANFGTDYNRVWYNHLWPWNNRMLWTGTSSSVSVYRYKNYDKIDRMAKKVSLNKTKLTLKKGQKVRLKAEVSPTSAYNRKVTWKSSNPKVAKVSANGTVKAVKKGRAVITAVTKDGSQKKASCIVKVGK